MAVTYTRKQGDTADDLIYQLIGTDGVAIGLAGATVRMIRQGKVAIIATPLNAAAPVGDPDRGKVRVEASEITADAGRWRFDTWVDYSGGDRQKFPRDDSDLLVIVTATVADPVVP